MEMFGAVMRF